MDLPGNDARFANGFLDPPIVKIVEALYGEAPSVHVAPRLDLLPLVNYTGPTVPVGTDESPIADMLRLNTGISATPIAEQRIANAPAAIETSPYDFRHQNALALGLARKHHQDGREVLSTGVLVGIGV